MNEGSAFDATVYFRDGATAATPSTVHYRIDCQTTCKEVRGWTALTPGEQVTVPVQASDSEIQCELNDYETKRITVAANLSQPNQVIGSIVYTVKNLKGWG